MEEPILNDYEDVKPFNIRETEINGRTYSIKLLPASVGIKVKEKIIKAFGPALGVLIDSSSIEEEFLLPEEQTFWTNIAIAIVSNMSELDLVATLKVLTSQSWCNGKEIDFDEHFAGNFGELYILVEFILKENFGDFFTVFLKAKGIEIPTLGEMMTIVKAQSQGESEEKSND